MSDAEKVNKITKATLVPVSLVVSLLGGSGWLTKQYYMSEANAKAIEKINEKLDKKDDEKNVRWDGLNKELKIIADRLGKIEGLLSK